MEGDYSAQLYEPDFGIQWTNVIAVSVLAQEFSCPICLQEPIVARIAPCGHYFCFPCLLRHFASANASSTTKLSGKCPICWEWTKVEDLRNVMFQTVVKYREGDTIKFSLVKRLKVSYHDVPLMID